MNMRDLSGQITRVLSGGALLVGLLGTSSTSIAAGVECEGGHDAALCRVHLSPGLTLETTVGNMAEHGNAGQGVEYEVWGDVQVVAGATRIPLNKANLTVITGDKPELYGESEVPLSHMPLLNTARLDTIPRASVGFASGDSLAELTGNNNLPLNDSLSESGTLRDNRKPYLLFHLDAGLSFKLNFPQELQFLNDVAFSIPGSFSATAILDVFDPYFYLSYTRTDGIDLNSLKRKPDDGSGVRVYEIMDEKGENVAMVFSLDTNTGRLEERNYVANTTIVYQRNSDGDYVQQNANGDPIVLSGSQFERIDRRDNPRDSDSDKSSGGDFIDAIGYSVNGWIPYEANTSGSMPGDVADFAGQLYLHGEIPLTPFVALDGEIVTYVGNHGVAQGGNGEVALTIPGVPDFIDFDIKLGNASAALQVTDNGQKVFVGGELKPDTAFLEGVLPIMPSGAAKVQGYIGNDLHNTQLSVEGEMELGVAQLGKLLGINLSDLALAKAKMSIGAAGIEVSGTTRVQISPDIRINSDIEVYAKIAWEHPEDVQLRLSGNMDVFGVALQDVRLDISRRGLFVNGAFVTPISRIQMAGSINESGPHIGGSGSVVISLGDISAAMDDAAAGLTAAQNEVNKINRDITAMRAQVNKERARDQSRLNIAQRAVTGAQNEVNKINNSIAAENRAINKQRANINSWYRWYQQGYWYQKPGRWIRYTAEKTWRSADIARRYVTIGALRVAQGVAIGALEVAKLALEGIKQGINVTPVDLDPRLAALFIARDTANVALEIAKKPFELFPTIDADIEAKMDLQLGVSGVSGKVKASVAGQPLLGGSVSILPKPNLCITLPVIGDVCTGF